MNKERIAQQISDLILGGLSISGACKKVGIKSDTVYSWIRRRNKFGLIILEALKQKKNAKQDDMNCENGSDVENTLKSLFRHFSTPISNASQHIKYNQQDTLVLILSDLHIGRKTPSFNAQVYKERMDHIFKVIQNMPNLPPEIHIFDLGDNVHGERVGTQGRMQDFEFGVPEQLTVSCAVLGELIDRLSQIFITVHWHDIPGNHGNLDKIYSSGSNWDLIRVKILESSKSTPNRVIFHRPIHLNRTIYSTANVLGHKFLITHGDSIKSYGGSPYSAIIKKLVSWRTFEEFDAACLGHFHTPSVLNFNGIPIIMNGTLVSGDEFGLQLGFNSPPSQTIFGVTKEQVVSWIYQINFS